ncbi:recombinase family protein [Zavarzinella formosa]|uniref:recombinase family protein n=1 Tax=Zavarzinella formosa TaxID=360055 RepID=UPI0002FE178F|nr:recombinase family protein [Zavarzinella formosa]
MIGTSHKGRGLFYHRDSEGHSELAAPQYVEWARKEAETLGVSFSGTAAAISDMIANGLSVRDDLYLDYGISGNHLSRPAFDALQRRLMTDPAAKYLFVRNRERLARPDNPLDAMQIETKLRKAGVTIVFMDKVMPAIAQGQRIPVADQIVSMIEYEESGKFRRNLALKLTHAKIELAETGFSIGGEPPYGFRRWLCSNEGVLVREIGPEIVKRPGHHVVWLPTASEEMAVVRRILDLIETIPASRIAKMLNAEGIPSPKAGRTRSVNGARVETSGQWTQNTVRNIATHSLLIGVWEYGKRSEGDQVRLTKDGPRLLDETDFRSDGTARIIINPEDQRIRTPAKSEAVMTREKMDRIRAVIEERGRHLKGKARTRGQVVNPLGGRIFDMNCGWPMYRYAKRKKWCYGCGLYQNSEAKCCRHNMVPGELATCFVFGCLRQRLLNPSAQAKLKARLLELAAGSQAEDPVKSQFEADKAELAAVRKKLSLVGQNLAYAESPEAHAAVAKVFGELKDKEARLEQQIAAYRPSVGQTNPGQEVGLALKALDRLTESVVAGEANWSVAGDVFNKTNAKLYLRFSEVVRGRRTFNVPAGGIVTFGSTPPPVTMYTGPTDRAIIRRMMAAGEPVTAVPERVAPEDSDAGQNVKGSANVQRVTRHCSRPGTSAVVKLVWVVSPRRLSWVVRQAEESRMWGWLNRRARGRQVTRECAVTRASRLITKRGGKQVADSEAVACERGSTVLWVAACEMDEDGRDWLVFFQCDLLRGCQPDYALVKVNARTGRAVIWPVI